MFKYRVEIILVAAAALLVLVNIFTSYGDKMFEASDTKPVIVENEINELHPAETERSFISNTGSEEGKVIGSGNLNSDASPMLDEDSNEDKTSSEEAETKDFDDELNVEEDKGIDFSSSEDFMIEVDLSRQIVLVYYNGMLIKEMICSGGTQLTPTPIGEFSTTEKVYYQWVAKFGVGAYYWTRFYKDYLFHSVPFNEDGEMIEEEHSKLGTPASHGCIRLKLDEAKWLYEKLPSGVRVSIHE
jgi:lipoprotein-anchoring transpeptidase ErfK/SrfK